MADELFIPGMDSDSETDTSEFLTLWEAKTLANLVNHINDTEAETKDSIFSILDSIDIKDEDHIAIFDAIKALHRSCDNVNLRSVMQWLNERNIHVQENRLRSIFRTDDVQASKLIHKLNTVFDPLPESEEPEVDTLISNMRTLVTKPSAKPGSTHPDKEIEVRLTLPLKQLIQIVESHGYRVKPLGDIN